MPSQTYQTHELFHDAFRGTWRDSISTSTVPKLESSVGATKILFVDSAPASAHEIDKKYLDLILGSKKWKMTATVSATLEASNFWGVEGSTGTADMHVEGMFDALHVTISTYYEGDYDESTTYTRNFDHGAVSQLEGYGYKAISSHGPRGAGTGAEEYTLRPMVPEYSNQPDSPFPSLQYDQNGYKTQYNEGQPFQFVPTNFSASESYEKAGNFTATGQHNGPCVKSSLEFQVLKLYITPDGCYIDYALGFTFTEPFLTADIMLSSAPIEYFDWMAMDMDAGLSTHNYQEVAPVTVFGKSTEAYGLWHERGFVIPSAAVNNITIDIEQVEAF